MLYNYITVVNKWGRKQAKGILLRYCTYDMGLNTKPLPCRSQSEILKMLIKENHAMRGNCIFEGCSCPSPNTPCQ